VVHSGGQYERLRADLYRRQFLTLAAATLIAGFALPLASAGWLLGLRVPTVTGSLLLGLAVILIGYGVAHYSALVEGRTIRRDFYYNAIAIGAVTGLNLSVTWVSVQFFGVPGVTFIFVALLAIITHSLVDVARAIWSRSSTVRMFARCGPTCTNWHVLRVSKMDWRSIWP
jgi:hypothetical protein